MSFNPLFLRTWADFFVLLIANPINILILVIVVLVFLFGMSRLNNRMEISSVNRAIALSRGMVGTVMWFVIGPAAGVIMLNIFALIYGVPGIPVGTFFKWLGLTSSSVWWLIRCAFGSESLSGGQEMYSVHALIRILVVLVPFGFIWLRSTKTRVMRLALVPLIIGALVVTRHKKAEETFITQDVDIETLRSIPLVGRMFDPPKKEQKRDDKGFTPLQRKIIAGSLVLVIVGGFVVGLYYQLKAAGIIVVVVGVLGFALVAPADQRILEDWPEDHPMNHDIDSLITRMNLVFAEKGKCLEVYDLSLQIEEAFHAQQETMQFPDSLCLKYKEYFYDWCSRH